MDAREDERAARLVDPDFLEAFDTDKLFATAGRPPRAPSQYEMYRLLALEELGPEASDLDLHRRAESMRIAASRTNKKRR